MTQAETRVCQNCKASFVIDASDFAFYEKMKVPAPTFCWECRMQRRFVWRNERTLYKRECGLCGKNSLSMYHPEAPVVVYCQECWISDNWDASSFGVEYDFSKSFFEQVQDLLLKVPRRMLFVINSENSPFTNYTRNAKNVYLSVSALESENIFFSKNTEKTFWACDCFDITDSENCYSVVKGDKNYNSSYLFESRNCIDCAFLYDCVNCKNCALSSNLRNKEFYIRNKPYTKEEYQKIFSSLNLGSASSVVSLWSEFEKIIKSAIHKYGQLVNAPSCSGDNITNSKNCRYCFNGRNSENLKYGFRNPGVKDSMDVVNAGPQAELFYEFIGGGGMNSKFLRFTVNGDIGLDDVYYTEYCSKCSNLFGCVGLRNKQYRILNKQYTKEEYEALVPRIIEHMNTQPYIDQKGRIYRYGEFFPPELSPFAYNETIAQEYFPLSEAEAKSKGYRWRDPGPKAYQITKQPADLPDHIKDVSDSITNEVIQCAHVVISDNPRLDQRLSASCNHQCTTAFRIIPEELQFYRRMSLPLPRLCPNCRHYQRLAQRNPLKLWHRTCQCAGGKSENGIYVNTIAHQHGTGHCPDEFETSYAPERKEIVYCETCYNAEVV